MIKKEEKDLQARAFREIVEELLLIKTKLVVISSKKEVKKNG